MAARLVQIYLPEDRVRDLEVILDRHTRRFWRETVPGAQEKYTCIVQQRYTERLLADLDEAFADLPDFSALVSELQAVLPMVEETPVTELPLSPDLPTPTRIERFFSRDRLSTDELYDDIEESLHPGPAYLLTVTLSAIIAGLGMRSGQTAVVIGAMIIAPLLGPTMGLALAATVGNWKLGRQAAATLAIGCVLAVLAGVVLGMTVAIDPLVPELKNRPLVQPADIARGAEACGEIDADAVRAPGVCKALQLGDIARLQHEGRGVHVVHHGTVDTDRSVGAGVIDHPLVQSLGQMPPVEDRAPGVAAFHVSVRIVPMIEKPQGHGRGG